MQKRNFCLYITPQRRKIFPVDNMLGIFDSWQMCCFLCISNVRNNILSYKNMKKKFFFTKHFVVGNDKQKLIQDNSEQTTPPHPTTTTTTPPTTHTHTHTHTLVFGAPGWEGGFTKGGGGFTNFAFGIFELEKFFEKITQKTHNLMSEMKKYPF